MANIKINFTGIRGTSYFATIERCNDGYYRSANNETFVNNPAFIVKAIPLTEGSTENAGNYSQLVNGDTWQDGLYILRIHNDNLCVGAELFAVKNGAEVPKGYETSVLNVYHADIQYTRNSFNGIDEYTVTWFKNGAPLLTGVSNITLQATNRADGLDLFGTTSMTQIGTTGSYKTRCIWWQFTTSLETTTL
jgi:hypothetical protein